jgi:hypothetical protein
LGRRHLRSVVVVLPLVPDGQYRDRLVVIDLE